MSETTRCPTCQGAGTVTVEGCAEIVNGRGCQNKMVPEAPRYLDWYPERKALAMYCGLHRNMRLRDRHQAELMRGR